MPVFQPTIAGWDSESNSESEAEISKSRKARCPNREAGRTARRKAEAGRSGASREAEEGYSFNRALGASVWESHAAKLTLARGMGHLGGVRF